MEKDFGENYQKTFVYLINKMMNLIRKFYILAYNIYGWYWLYKIIASPKLSGDWENYVTWFFAMAAQLFFIIDVRKANKDIDVRELMKENLPK